MPDLLLEIFSEEIPARMQPRAREDLKRLVTERQSYILRVRELAKACGAAWLKTVAGGYSAPAA